MYEKRYHLFLEYVLESISLIEEYTADKKKKEILASQQLQDAVIKIIEIIGGAVKQIDEVFIESHHEIEWKKIAGFRDILIHRYFSIDWDIVWDIIQNKVPELREKINKMT